VVHRFAAHFRGPDEDIELLAGLRLPMYSARPFGRSARSIASSLGEAGAALMTRRVGSRVDCDPHDSGHLERTPVLPVRAGGKQPRGTMVFFVPDSSPRKPDRWLALPVVHSPGMHQMSALPADVRTELWRAAIGKAKELWDDHWAVAYNAEPLHTQCHVHIHIGKLIDGVEWGEFKVVDGPDQIPLPGPDGLWIHPVDGKLHVQYRRAGDGKCIVTMITLATSENSTILLHPGR